MTQQTLMSWPDALAEIEAKIAVWRQRKRMAQIICPAIGGLFVYLFWWGGSWTLRAFFLPLAFLMMMIFLAGVLLPGGLRDKLVDAVERDITMDDIPYALRLLALLPTLGIRQGGEVLQQRVVSRLALASREQLTRLQEPERNLLYSWAERGTKEEKIKALLVLAMIKDKASRNLALRYQLDGSDIDEQVREAAADFLKQVE